MAETRIADNVAWHIHKEAKKQPKMPKPLKERKKIDTKFEAWAAKNNVNLKDIPLMSKERSCKN